MNYIYVAAIIDKKEGLVYLNVSENTFTKLINQATLLDSDSAKRMQSHDGEQIMIFVYYQIHL